ncbi:MAG: TspO/MBR family protein [Lysinibacillus sp.]
MKQWILMLIAYVIMVTTNALANILPINGQTTSEISNRLDVPFTPAGYVFSIWGLIYFLLAIWLIAAFTNRNTDKVVPAKTGSLFILSCLLNATWLFSFHYEQFVLSSVIIVALLITLIFIHQSYPKGDSRFGGRLPFSFYLGWISVATIANINYTLKFHDVSLGIGEIEGTIGLVIIAGLLGIAGRYLSDDPFYALVFVWAIIGIGVANSGTGLETASYMVAIVIFFAILITPLLGRKKTSYA